MAKQAITVTSIIRGVIVKIRQICTPPVFFNDEDKTRNARILYILLFNMLIILLLSSLATIFIYVKKIDSGIIILILSCLLLACFILARRGRIQHASTLYIVGIWTLQIIMIVLTGSMNIANNAMLIAIIVIASILLGKRYAIIIAIVSSILYLGLVILENSGYLFMHYFLQPPLASWIALVIAFILTITPLYLTLEGSAQALARARKSEKRYSTLFNEAPMMYLTINAENEMPVIKDCNTAFLKTLGFARNEVVGQSLKKIYPIKSTSTFFKGIGLQNEMSKTDTLLKRDIITKDGHLIHLLVRISPDINESGQVTGLLVMGLDITDNKHVEDALLESESRYRAFFEKGPDGVVILDPETGQIIEFNDQACQQLGYSREEFGMLHVSDIDVVETPDEVQQHINKTMINGRDDFETLHRTKQGEIRNIQVTAQVIKTDKRSIYHCIWRDITERKQAEEELQKRIKELIAWHNVTIGRENRIIELKDEVNILLAKLGQPLRYEVTSHKNREHLTEN